MIVMILVVGIWYLQTHTPKPFLLPEKQQNMALVNDPTPSPEGRTIITRHEFHYKIKDEEGKTLSHVSIELKQSDGNLRKVLQSDAEGCCIIHVEEYENLFLSFAHSSCFSLNNIALASFPRDKPFHQIRLHRKKKIAGMIRSDTDVQIAGATVTVHSASYEFVVPQQEIHTITTSHQNGDFKLFPLPAGECVLFVTHPDFLPHYEPCRIDNENVLIQLRKRANLHVHVKDDQGVPIGGGSVVLHTQPGESAVIQQQKETNIHGSVLFENLRPLAYRIQASSALSGTSATAIVDLHTADDAEITLTLHSNRFSLSGKVLDVITSNGVSSATVACQSMHRNRKGEQLRCVTGVEGDFRFHELFPDYYQLFVEEMEEYISGNYSKLQSFGVREPLILSHFVNQDITNCILWVKPAWKISGRVLDENNQGLADTEVSLWIHFRPEVSVGYAGSKPIGKEAVTSSDGSYELVGNVEYNTKNAYVFVKAMHSAYGGKHSEIMQPQPGDHLTKINIQYRDELNVTGMVKNTKGEGIPNAVVFFYHFAGDAPATMVGRAITNKSGKYFIHLDPGSFFCHAEAAGHGPSKREPPPQITISGEEKQTIDFTVTQQQELMNGVVLTSDYNPIVDVEICAYLYKKGDSLPKNIVGNPITKTNEDGYFHLDTSGLFWPVRNPLYRITAIPPDASGFSVKTIDDVSPNQSDLKIVLEEKEDYSFEIYGQVLAPHGDPVPSYELLVMPRITKVGEDAFLSNQSLYTWQSIYSPNGEFHILGADCTEGPFLICISHPDHGLAVSDQIEVMPLEVRKNVIIPFLPPMHIKGIVLDANDQTPVEGAHILVQLTTSLFNDYSAIQAPGYVRRLSMRGASREQAWLQQYLPRTKSNAGGLFVLDNLPRIPLWIVIMSGIHEPLFQRFVPPENRSLVELQPILLKVWSRNQQPPEPIIELNTNE